MRSFMGTLAGGPGGEPVGVLWVKRRRTAVVAVGKLGPAGHGNTMPSQRGLVNPVPTLDELAAHPERIADVPPERRTRVVLACSAIIAAAAAVPGASEATPPANG